MTVRRSAAFTAGCVLVCCIRFAAAQTHEETIVIRQDAILQDLAWRLDGKVVATVGVTHDGSTFNSTVKLWDALTGELVRAFNEERDCQTKIAFSRDYLAIAVNANLRMASGGPREVRLLDAASGELRHTIDKTLVPGLTHWSALAFSSDGKRLATAGWGRTSPNDEIAPFVKVWHCQKGQVFAQDVEYLTSEMVQPLARRVNRISCIVFSPDGRLVAAGFADSKIRLFSGLTGKLLATLDSDGAPGPDHFGSAGITFSPDGKTLAYPGIDNSVVLCDVADGKPRLLLKGHERRVTSITFATDGRLLATGSRAARPDSTIQVFLWDARSGERKHAISNIVQPVNVLAFSPDGRTLGICAGAGDNLEGKTWRTAGEIILRRLE